MTDQGAPRTLDRTKHFSEGELDTIRSSHDQSGAPQQVSLLFRHRRGVEVVTLGEGQSLSVGRSHPADLVLTDESLSRQHASLELVDGEVWVEDLGSTNGTRVDGLVVERAKVSPESELALGAVAVAIHVASGDLDEEGGLESHDRFLRTLTAEIARARAHRRSLSLLLVRSGQAGAAASVSRWLAVLREHLRVYDVAALYSDDTVEVVLPEAAAAEASARAEKVLADEPSLRCGVGVYPEQATSAEELLDVTRAALQATSDAVPLRTASVDVASRRSCDDDEVVVRSQEMERVFESARRFGDMAMPVLIQGETGTGKEVVARLIHDAGARKDKPFVCVNCGAIPDTLIESTLFGHERGAFTGAHQQSKGVFESAHRGTVFLDEIGELPLQAQAALLRVLETQRFSRVGSTKEIQVDVRVLAATHRDLEAMCQRGDFREDLFFRLDAMAVFIPPLRERVEELEPLIERFVASANRSSGRSVEGVDEETLELLKGYRWPGNVRELRNVIERAVVVARGARITVDDLPRRVARVARTPPPVAGPAERQGTFDLREEMQRYEADLIRRALEAAGGDRTRAANDLGVAVRTLYYKLKQHGINE